MSTAASVRLARSTAAWSARVFVDRLMFGSDQMAWPETIGKAVEAIESADSLSREQKCDIFFNNAVRFSASMQTR